MPSENRALPHATGGFRALLGITGCSAQYVLDYLKNSFPTQLFELFTDDEGNLLSRPAYDEAGNPVTSMEAVERRDRMIEHLASLPPVQGALDQILRRSGRRSHWPLAPHRQTRRPPVRRKPSCFGQFCRNRRLHG